MSTKTKLDPEALLDPGPEASAELAGLRYVTDEEPGIRRKRWGRGFTYLDVEGEHITDEEERARLDALAIPPAYTDVWICPDPRGHLQATGRDEKGRKQYQYHPDWEDVRNATKFNRMIPFGEALPDVRARCESDLRRRGLPRDKVLATVVSLLDRTLIRIGNAQYAEENGSYGLTTFRDRHVDFSGQRCTFAFRGKSGKEHCIELDDPRLARVVRRCRDIPGYHLFQCYDDDSARYEIGSGDVNAYLQETTGQPFTAKDFRTWGGSVYAAEVLYAMEKPEDEKAAQAQVVEMVKRVAERLGNTTAVCRKYYIHPYLIEAYEEGDFRQDWGRRFLRRKGLDGLRDEEGALLHFLRDRLAA